MPGSHCATGLGTEYQGCILASKLPQFELPVLMPRYTPDTLWRNVNLALINPSGNSCQLGQLLR